MWPDSEETQQLLKNARGGDEQAINRLLDRHRDSLRRMVQMRLDRAVAQRVDASDVVQDVLLEASRRLDDFISDAKMPFHLWLRQLAKDQIIDMHRRHRSAQRRSVDREQKLAARGLDEQSSLDLLAQVRDGELTPAAASIRRELEQRFLAALDRLSDEERDIILMRHFEHLSNGDVARVLDMSGAAAGMRHLRALRRLRGILGENDEGT
jgi:RNA polymerase sigma-70 factor (ECF subfamily)